MHIKIAYGNEEVPIDVPDNWINGRCYRPHPLQKCPDVHGELLGALGALSEEHSLRGVAAGKKTCAIAIDTESAALFEELLPALIEEIEDSSDLSAEHITIILTNRAWHPFGPEVIEALVDDSIRSRSRVVLHDPFNRDAVVHLGESSRQVPLTVNRAYMEADLRIIVGGVRPDLLCGFTGGRSVLMPGLSGKHTIRRMHDFRFVTDKNTRFGGFRDNPFHIVGMETVNAAQCHLTISAVMTAEGHVHRIFAGHFGQSHLMAMNHMREAITVRVKEPMDIVVTSCGGAPCDSSAVRFVTTLSAVQHVLKPEGTIVMAAALDQGFDLPLLKELIDQRLPVAEALEALSLNTSFVPGQWIIQRLYSILRDHEIILYNRTLDEDFLWSVGLTPAKDLNEAVFAAMESHGQRCKIVALPDGCHGIGEVGGTAT